MAQQSSPRKFSVDKGSPQFYGASLLAIHAFLIVLALGIPRSAFGQLPPPDKRSVFMSDRPDQHDLQKATVESATKPDKPANENLDFQAPKIEFHRETNQVSGSGGIVVSEGGVQIQADEGIFNTETRQGQVKGNVIMTTPDAVFSADSANLTIPSETGDFSNVEFTLEQGNYHVVAEQARKISEFEFEVENADFTTCHCADGGRPWMLSSSTCNITQEGYAHSYNTTFYFEGVPVFYSPYFIFPVKTERASGLLAPLYGYNNRNGVMYTQPLFMVVDDSTDFTLAPFIETRTRVGSSLQYRQLYSTSSKVDTKFYYSNESRRGDSLRGINPAGYYDSTIDSNRTGGYFTGQWRPDPKENLPIELVGDAHWTSDNLFVKEIEDQKIGDRQSQYLVSTAVARGLFFEKLNLEARTEYNQMLLAGQPGQDPQAIQFQRVPELNAGTSYTIRPFGFNPYGLKVVTSGTVSGTEFVRDQGYDGWRTIMRPQMAVPFHISNYVRGQFGAQLNHMRYSLNETETPDGLSELDESSSRTVPVFGYNMSSGVERVYDLERGNWFSTLMGLGADNSGRDLVRLKHTIEPNVSYTYVPDVDRDGRPLFDANDSLPQRRLFMYGFTSRLYGRFSRPYERSRDVEELAPSPQTLPRFDMSGALLNFDRNMVLTPPVDVETRQGEVRELVTFSMRQAYDRVEEEKNLDPTRGPFSDVNLGLALQPSSYFGFGFGGDVRTADKSFSQYGMTLGFRDDRDDAIRARYSFIDNSASQVDGNIEIKIIERLKLGYYASFSEKDSKMIESRGLIRFINSCNCWSMDLGFRDQSDNNQQSVLLTFTFTGLGDITQNIGFQQNNQTPAQQ